MKVLQVLSKSVGGIRIHVAGLNNHLNQSGITSHIAGPKGVMDDLADQHIHFDTPTMKNPLKLRSITRKLREAFSDYDVIHAHGLTAARLALSADPKKPLITTLHNVVDPFAAGKKYLVMKLLEDNVVKKSSHIICPSNFAKEHIRNVQNYSEKISVILPIGKQLSDQDIKQAVNDSIEVKNKFAENQKLVVSISRYSKQKDLETLITAFSHVVKNQDAKLVIAGGGSQNYKNDLAFLIGRLELADSVVLLDFVDNANALIAAADLLVISSRYETVPFVLLESLILGTQVVSTDVGVAREVLNESQIVPVGDVDSMSRTISNMLNNPAALETNSNLVANFREPKEAIEQLISIYEANNTK